MREIYMLSTIETFVINRMVDTKELNNDLDNITKSFTAATLMQCGLDALKLHLRKSRTPIKY